MKKSLCNIFKTEAEKAPLKYNAVSHVYVLSCKIVVYCESDIDFVLD